MLRSLRDAIDFARDQGAHVTGTFPLHAIKPTANRQQRARSTEPVGHDDWARIHRFTHRLSPIEQASLWVDVLTGDRISEGYGLEVDDFERDEHGRGWLAITKQGGQRVLVRDADGQFVWADGSSTTKTPASKRRIPIPHKLADLLDLLIEIFHTDPRTGRVHGDARLIPGIGKDDASGQSTFRTALARAMDGTGARFTPHDLRHAMVTLLKDEGVEDRLRRAYVGHELGRDVHDGIYDDGPRPGVLLQVATVLDRVLEARLGDALLWQPTTRQNQWGAGTRNATRSEEIRDALEACGWLLPRARDTERGPLLSVTEAALVLGRSQVRTRAAMRTGQIRAHQELWGTRHVWVAFESDVRAFQHARTGVTIDALAVEHNLAYHQMYHLVKTLGLVPDGQRGGERILLDDTAAGKVRAEMGRQRGIAARAMLLADAAERLRLPIAAVESLVRSGHLDRTDGPTDTRHRWVTIASVEAYEAQYPAQPQAVDGTDTALTITEARTILGRTRPQITHLTRTRQLQLVRRPGSRHVYVTAESALDHARQVGNDAAVTTLTARLSQTHSQANTAPASPT